MDDLVSIMSALENDLYKWRTISGISKETGIPSEKVKMIIGENGGMIMQSSALSPAGEALFTSRRKHNKESSAWSRIGSALRNRAD
ncbi:hypothetical protein N5C60_11505 [Pseudomonas mosselii]|uniref:hypothetical protein n=1 Tax=Pseudomonas mosselii TaxID=78327 RepID=UPI00244D4367|nr:hypothetical protein [Pseudomonas mosselii]MDH1145245.1 hypothetical protein [Pseudomonas mosselii]